MFRAIVLTLLLIQAPPIAHQQQTPSQNKNDNTKTSPIDTHLQNEQGSPKEQSKWWQPPPLWDIYWPTVGLLIATGIAVWTAVRTLNDMDAQIAEMRATGQQTDRLIAENIAQSASMAKSVEETARFAAAMESVGKSLEITAKISAETAEGLRQQMRAYINVSVGGAIYQERNKQLKFQAKPVITNNGLTPAHNVRQKVKAAILPRSIT